jgi:hypothetical protein
MVAVYQPRARLRRVLLLGLLAAACRDDAAPRRTFQAPPRSWPLEVFLASRAWEIADVDASGRLLANEWIRGAARAVRIAAGGGREPLAPGEPGSHRALAALAGDEVLVELAPAAAGSGRRLSIATGRGAPRALPAAVAGRFLGADREGARLWVASAGADGAERLLEVSRLGPGRELLAAPPGFRFAAVARDGTLAAMVRPVAPGADEVVLVDRRRGERRLILPTGADGRFSPLRFAEDGRRLLIAADDGVELARLDWLDLDGGGRSPALAAPECAALGVRAAGGAVVADLVCAGVRRAALLEAGTPPWEGRLPPDSTVTAALPAGQGAWWLELAGPATARDLARLDRDGVLVPLTWALAPRLEPVALVRPAAESLETGAARLPVEVWRPPVGARAAAVWLEDDGAPSRWGEFHPLHAYLAARGVLVLRLRPRGPDGSTLALREAGGGDSVAEAGNDVARAAARARALAGGPVPVALVVEGARWQALAAPESPDPFALRLALEAQPSHDALAAAGHALETGLLDGR